MQETWTVLMKKADFYGIASRFGIDPVIARILHNRGISTDEEIRSFLFGSLADLNDPLLLLGMETRSIKMCLALQQLLVKIFSNTDITSPITIRLSMLTLCLTNPGTRFEYAGAVVVQGVVVKFPLHLVVNGKHTVIFPQLFQSRRHHETSRETLPGGSVVVKRKIISCFILIASVCICCRQISVSLSAIETDIVWTTCF